MVSISLVSAFAEAAPTDCDSVANHLMQVASASEPGLSQTSENAKAAKADLMSTCETRWGQDDRSCFLGAKTTDAVTQCDVTSLDRRKASSGWESLAEKSEWDTDPSSLCDALSTVPSSTRDYSSCYKAYADYAFNQQTVFSSTRGGRPLNSQLAALSSRYEQATEQCVSALTSDPYVALGFNSDQACSAFDKFIDADMLVLKSGQLPEISTKGLRANVDNNVRLKSRCATLLKGTLAKNTAARRAVAESIPLAVIRDIPPSLRLPEERARMKREATACQQEASRRLSERSTSVATRSLQSFREIEPEYLLPEERQRLAIEAASEATTKPSKQAAPPPPTRKSSRPSKTPVANPIKESECVMAARALARKLDHCELPIGSGLELCAHDPQPTAKLQVLSKASCRELEDFLVDAMNRQGD